LTNSPHKAHLYMWCTYTKRCPFSQNHILSICTRVATDIWQDPALSGSFPEIRLRLDPVRKQDPLQPYRFVATLIYVHRLYIENCTLFLCNQPSSALHLSIDELVCIMVFLLFPWLSDNLLSNNNCRVATLWQDFFHDFQVIFHDFFYYFQVFYLDFGFLSWKTVKTLTNSMVFQGCSHSELTWNSVKICSQYQEIQCKKHNWKILTSSGDIKEMLTIFFLYISFVGLSTYICLNVYMYSDHECFASSLDSSLYQIEK
jgi:hypothetical protein